MWLDPANYAGVQGKLPEGVGDSQTEENRDEDVDDDDTVSLTSLKLINHCSSTKSHIFCIFLSLQL